MSEPQEEGFLNKEIFTRMVERTVIDKQLSYMDAIIHLCETNNIELEDSRKYVSTIIKSKLEAEAKKLNFIPRENELPFE